MPRACSAQCPAHFEQPPHLHSHSLPWSLHPLFFCPSVVNPQPVSHDTTPSPSLKPCTFSHPLCDIHPSHESHHMLTWFWGTFTPFYHFVLPHLQPCSQLPSRQYHTTIVFV